MIDMEEGVGIVDIATVARSINIRSSVVANQVFSVSGMLISFTLSRILSNEFASAISATCSWRIATFGSGGNRGHRFARSLSDRLIAQNEGAVPSMTPIEIE